MCEATAWSATGLVLVAVVLCGMGTATAQDGAIVGWGRQVVLAQSELADLVAVAAGSCHNLGLKADGSIVAWGDNPFGQCDIPPPNSGFVAFAGGFSHSLGVKADGSILAWGDNWIGQCDVPAPNSGFVAAAGGYEHSLGLKAFYGDLNCDGTVDFGDINPFVLYLSNIDAWRAAFPRCHALNGDINGDGTYGQWSFGDINPFVELLINGK